MNTKKSNEVKKSLKSLTPGIRDAANNIQHYNSTAADSVREWLTL